MWTSKSQAACGEGPAAPLSASTRAVLLLGLGAGLKSYVLSACVSPSEKVLVARVEQTLVPRVCSLQLQSSLGDPRLQLALILASLSPFIP